MGSRCGPDGVFMGSRKILLGVCMGAVECSTTELTTYKMEAQSWFCWHFIQID